MRPHAWIAGADLAQAQYCKAYAKTCTMLRNALRAACDKAPGTARGRSLMVVRAT
jgi:hypothetical protein